MRGLRGASGGKEQREHEDKVVWARMSLISHGCAIANCPYNRTHRNHNTNTLVFLCMGKEKNKWGYDSKEKKERVTR